MINILERKIYTRGHFSKCHWSYQQHPSYKELTVFRLRFRLLEILNVVIEDA